MTGEDMEQITKQHKEIEWKVFYSLIVLTILLIYGAYLESKCYDEQVEQLNRIEQKIEEIKAR